MTATATTYRFARVKCHAHIEISSWYLVIKREDLELFMDMHKSATQSAFMRYHRDPHLFDQKTWQPLNAIADILNPVRMGAGWLKTAMKGLSNHGVIYMNCAHGLLFGEFIEVLEEMEREKLAFPVEDEHKEGVKITVCRWGDGQHYYLKASNNQVFSQPKFNTAQEAMDEARWYAFEKNIRMSDEYVYSRQGD